MWPNSSVFAYKVRGSRFESHSSDLNFRNCECSEQRVRWYSSNFRGKILSVHVFYITSLHSSSVEHWHFILFELKKRLYFIRRESTCFCTVTLLICQVRLSLFTEGKVLVSRGDLIERRLFLGKFIFLSRFAGS